MIRSILLRGGLVAAAVAVFAACADDGAITRSAAPQGSAALTVSTLPRVNFRRLVDSVTNTLIAKGSGEYDVPTAGALDTMVMAIDSVLAGRVAAADSMLDRYAYDVYSIRETASEDSLVVIRERKATGSTKVARGWGFYAFNPSAANRADIHVNHPVDDQHSEDIAGDLYQRCDCRWFLMAGARRAANVENDTISDMARHTATVFHQVHVRVAGAGSRALSIHGFNVGNHDDELPANVTHVLAVGRTTSTTTPQYLGGEPALRTALVDSAFVAGLHDVDEGYDALGATHNPQGRHSNDLLGWGHWLHIEHERVVRDDSAAWKKSNGILRQWIVDHPAQ